MEWFLPVGRKGDGKRLILVKMYKVSVKMNKFWESIVQHGAYSNNNIFICLKIAKRVATKMSHYEKISIWDDRYVN